MSLLTGRIRYTVASMSLTDENRSVLLMLVDLINSGRNDQELLADAGAIEEFARRHDFSAPISATSADVELTHAVREDFETVFDSDAIEDVVAAVNSTLLRCNALPQLVRHDGWDWHLHGTAQTAPLPDRFAIDIAFALIDLIREHELSRLQVCAAEDCNAVFVDFSRNRSKRFCDTGNCANRTHVAAYRKRQEEQPA